MAHITACANEDCGELRGPNASKYCRDCNTPSKRKAIKEENAKIRKEAGLPPL